MTLDILICSLNKGIVRIQDVLLPPRDDIHYVVSYQYTDERYLDLIPKGLTAREDVTIYTYKGQGLSANRNLALDKATADIVMYADDDAHLLPQTPEIIFKHFAENDRLLLCVYLYWKTSEDLSLRRFRRICHAYRIYHFCP